MREAVPRGLCLTHALAHTHTRAPGSVRQFASAHSHTHTHTHTSWSSFCTGGALLLISSAAYFKSPVEDCVLVAYSYL